MIAARETYTLPEVAKLLDVEYRTLHHWMTLGLLSAIQTPEGSGRAAVLGPDDLRRARLLVCLRRAGFELAVLRLLKAVVLPSGPGELSFDIGGDVKVSVYVP